jgi:hypothetical protein
VSEPIGLAFIHRAHLKGYFHLRNLRDECWISCLPKRMNYLILEVFLELKIRYIQRFEIVVEIKARKDLRSCKRTEFILLILDFFFNFDVVLSNR